jgi:hypothetical protein
MSTDDEGVSNCAGYTVHCATHRDGAMGKFHFYSVEAWLPGIFPAEQIAYLMSHQEQPARR